MYAVKKNETSMVTYVEVAGDQLILRPQNQGYPIEILPIEDGTKPEDYIIGRVCYVGIET